MKQFDDAVMAVAKKLDEKKARDIVLLDVSKATILAETFIICSGTSPNKCECWPMKQSGLWRNRAFLKRDWKDIGKGAGSW